MRFFTEAEEDAVFRLGRARAWLRTGLISASQGQAISQRVGAARRTAGVPVRLLFFFFICVAQAGCLWLGKDFFLRGHEVVGLFMAALGAACYLSGEAVLRRTDHYRFGVEEALLLGAAVWIVAGAAAALNLRPERLSIRLAALGAAAAGAFLYARFGYWAGLLAVVAAAVPSVDTFKPSEPRLALLGVYGAAFALSWLRRSIRDSDRAGWELLQGVLLLAVYLCLNLRLEFWSAWQRAPGHGAFYWGSLAACAAVGAGGLFAGLRLRHRALLVCGGICLLLTVCSIKGYRGVPRNVWDPASLGLTLMALAVFLSRWLRAGRGGFTSEPLIVPRGEGAAAGAWLAAGAAHGAAGQHGAPSPERAYDGGGGSSGGAGASGGF